jgi:hypothetical protein
LQQFFGSFLQKRTVFFVQLMPAATRLRVLLHIGPQKTGTSYMQSRFYHVRERLRRHGIAYHLPPEDSGLGRPGFPAQASDLGTLLLHGDMSRFAADVAAVREAGLKCLLISTEMLSKLKPEQIAPLGEIFAGDTVEVYAYCRRWSDRLPSHWWQQVSTGLTTPFPQWWARALSMGARNWLVNESLVWQRWANLFGRDTVHILSYDTLRAAGVDIADDFLHDRLRWTGRLNTGAPRRDVRTMPAALEIEVLRTLHVYAAEAGVRLTAACRHAALERLRLAQYEPFRSIAGDALDTVEIDDTGPLFADSRLAMQLWQDRLATSSLSPELMLARSKPYRFVPPEALQTDAARAAFGDLLQAA